MKCIIKKLCKEEVEEVGEVELTKFRGIYRGFQHYWCPKCKQYFMAPVGTLSRQEFDKLKKDD